MNLKEARIKSKTTQSRIAAQLHVSIPKLSNFENNVELPALPKMILLNRLFNTVINWEASLSPTENALIIESIAELSKLYPLRTVIEFCVKTFRRYNDPAKVIKDFACKSASKHESIINVEQ